MKKRLILSFGLVLCVLSAKNEKIKKCLIFCLIFLLCGCSASNTAIQETDDPVQISEEVTEETKEENTEEVSNVVSADGLYFIYDKATDYDTIYMGTNIDSVQTRLFELTIPVNYTISAAYASQKDDKSILDEMEDVLASDYLENMRNENKVVSDISLHPEADSETIISYDVSFPNKFDIAEDKEAYPDGTDIDYLGHEVYYFRSESYYLMDVDLGDGIILWVTYDSPDLDDKNIDDVANGLLAGITFLN